MSFNKSRKETMMRPGGELEVVEEEEEEEEEEEDANDNDDNDC